MLVRQIIAASLLAVTAVGAMSQELDVSDTLAARNIASAQQQAQARAGQGRTRESVRAETRNLQAQGELATVGERSDAREVYAMPEQAPASGLSRAQVKSELAQWRTAHPARVGEFG